MVNRPPIPEFKEEMFYQTVLSPWQIGDFNDVELLDYINKCENLCKTLADQVCNLRVNSSKMREVLHNSVVNRIKNEQKGKSKS